MNPKYILIARQLFKFTQFSGDQEHIFPLDEFSAFLPELIKAIEDGSESERKELIHITLSVLNNSNFEEFEMLHQIIKATLTGICEYRLLSISAITAMVITEAQHFIQEASKWAYEVYIYNFIGFAIDYEYPFTEIADGINNSTEHDVGNFLTVLQQIEIRSYEREESSDLIHQIINYIQTK